MRFLGENYEDIEQKHCFFSSILGLSIVFLQFYWQQRKKNSFRCSKRYILTQQKLHPDVVKNTSRRSKRYVVTQQKIRPDVVQDTSGRNFRSVLVAIRKLFCRK